MTVVAFIDWRPVASTPIIQSILKFSDWQKFRYEKYALEYRYVCRNDGFFYFEFRNVTEDSNETSYGSKQVSTSTRLNLSISKRLSHYIKSLTGHGHLFHHVSRYKEWEAIANNPIWCEKFTNTEEINDLLKTVLDTEKLKVNRAYHVETEQLSDENAILVVKRMFSNLFDRVSNRSGEIDQNWTSLGIETLRFRMFWQLRLLVILWFLGILALIATATSLDQKSIIIPFILTALLGLSAAIFFLHFRFHIYKTLYRKIRLYERLHAYSVHGNTLCRILGSAFNNEAMKASGDFTTGIAISNSMISSITRRVNRHFFAYTFSLTILSLLLSMTASFLNA